MKAAKCRSTPEIPPCHPYSLLRRHNLVTLQELFALGFSHFVFPPKSQFTATTLKSQNKSATGRYPKAGKLSRSFQLKFYGEKGIYHSQKYFLDFIDKHWFKWLLLKHNKNNWSADKNLTQEFPVWILCFARGIYYCKEPLSNCLTIPITATGMQ